MIIRLAGILAISLGGKDVIIRTSLNNYDPISLKRGICISW